jgi:predicted SnoaL-like aldol condensation-catalyzing enzyme
MIAMRKTAGAIALALVIGAALPVSGRAQSNAAEGGSACTAPHQYVKLINEGKYDLIGSLFAADAVYMGPDGKTRHGSKAIGAFYEKLMGDLKPQVKAVSYIEHGDDCLMELDNKDKKSGKWELIAIDHFTVDPQGKVAKFIVYLRPGSAAGRQLNAALTRVH